MLHLRKFTNIIYMKNSKSRLAFIAIVLLFTTSIITSCGKTDTSDGDEKGNFSLTIDGVKYDGTEVFNAAAVGVRTISAKNTSMELAVLLNEEDFKPGATFDLKGGLSYLKLGTSTSLPTSGTIKVVSISKIEIDAIFYDAQADKDYAVTGYVSSK